MPRIAVIAGSRSDQHILDQVCDLLREFDIDHESIFLSAHRDRRALEDYVKKSDAEVFIGIAGLSAHLPGFIASMTTKPVIGVPVSAKLQGMDALLSIVQMPSGVPVACVGIDGGKNAALLAIEIFALKDEGLSKRLREYRERMMTMTMAADH